MQYTKVANWIYQLQLFLLLSSSGRWYTTWSRQPTFCQFSGSRKNVVSYSKSVRKLSEGHQKFLSFFCATFRTKMLFSLGLFLLNLKHTLSLWSKSMPGIAFQSEVWLSNLNRTFSYIQSKDHSNVFFNSSMVPEIFEETLVGLWDRNR